MRLSVGEGGGCLWEGGRAYNPNVYGGPATELQADVENGADKCAINVQNV